MNTTTNLTLTASLILGTLASTTLHADDPLFEVSAFITGIDGDGFVGDEAAERGLDWSFPVNQSNEYFIHNVNDLPLQFQNEAMHPNGGETRGAVIATSEVTDTSVEILAITSTEAGVNQGGDLSLFTQSYVHVHGEFHLAVQDDVEVHYDLCGFTLNSSAWTKLFIRKLVNGNFQTVVEHIISSHSPDLDCLEGDLLLEPGTYQLYFSTYSYITNPGYGANWKDAGSALQGKLEFALAPSIADINGDGVVDGQDLARLLGAWGSSAGGGDLNGDGTVDGKDLAILLGEWTD